MSISGVNSGLAELYRYAQKAQKAGAKEADFAEKLQNAGETGKLQNAGETEGAPGVEEYQRYLQKKYGNVKIESIPKDQATLEKVGKSMSGSDVVIAPNILEKMAGDPKVGAYYEQKIDYFFNEIVPRETAICAAKGLVFEPAGVVVHEDGTVTYICGCSDSPERVAEVNAINKAKREKRAAMREAALAHSLKAAELRRLDLARRETRRLWYSTVE